MFDSLGLHGLQHTRLSCPSPTRGACSNSCPSSWWCHPTISSSVVPFSSCLQSFPASGSFLMSQLFTSGGQSIGASVLVLPMNIQDWFPLEWTGLISLQSKGLLKSLLQHHSSKASILQCSAFFTLQCSHPYMNTGKTIALTIQIFVSKAMSLLSRFVKIPPYRSDYKLSEAHWNLAQRLGQNWKHRVLQVWDKEFWSYLNLGLNPGSTIYKLY